MYEVYLTRNAYKSLKLLDEKIKDRIKEVLRKLTSFPEGLDVKKLKGFKNKYRIRVGDYRIIVEVQKGVIVVIEILPRKIAYRK